MYGNYENTTEVHFTKFNDPVINNMYNIIFSYLFHLVIDFHTCTVFNKFKIIIQY